MSLARRMLPTIALLGACLVFPGGCSLFQSLAGGFEKPKLHFKRMHVREMSFSGAKLEFEFELENPNAVGLKVAQIDYRLDIDGKQLIAGKTGQGVELKPKGISPLLVPVEVEFVKLGQALQALFSSRDKLAYRLRAGFAVDTPIGLVRLPVDLEGHIPLPRLPEVALAGVSVGRLDMMSASFELRLLVTNRAGFALRHVGAQYQAAVSGFTVAEGRTEVAEIQPGQTSELAIPLSVGFIQIGAAAVKMIRNRQLPYVLSGELRLGPLKQPFRLEGVADL